MGLRFRKSVSLFPGVKLNFGKTGMSVSTGVPGFRKTFHSSGRVTTSVGIPGTGIYYVDTKNPSSQSNRKNHRAQPQTQTNTYPEYEQYETQENYPETNIQNEDYIAPVISEDSIQLDANSLKSIHKSSDDTIDWTEVLVSSIPPDDTYNSEMWGYYHEMAPKVLSGDIDTYLKLIYEVNPLDDLLAYGKNFEFGTDDSKKIEVEFVVNEEVLNNAKNKMNFSEYNSLLQDFVCSVVIRIARDMFALLPVKNTIIHAVLDDKTILSVDFDRNNLSKVKFGYIDPSDTLQLFRNNMSFSEISGFDRVQQL